MRRVTCSAALGLTDEYRLRVHPVLVGGSIPFFPECERRVHLDLVETHPSSSGVLHLRHRHRVARR